MSVAAKTREPARDSVDLYRVRDELAQAYNPDNAFERMLLSQMAQSWLRLQRAQEAEHRYFQAHDVLDAISTDFKTYQAVTRLVAECDRAWRRAKWHLEKAQGRRRRTDTASPNLRRSTGPPAHSAATAPPRPTPDSTVESIAAHSPVPEPSG